MTGFTTQSAHILMVDPAHFDVHYAINPWMQPEQWAADNAALKAAAQTCFVTLRDSLEQVGCRISTEQGAAGLPDMVFPANAGIVLDRRVLLARFRHPQRQGEEEYFAAIFRALQARGEVDRIDAFPSQCFQEGAGDCIWDAVRGHFWLGWGPRSVRQAAPIIADYFQQQVVPLELVTERCYHLDVCFCPLSGGEVLYYPAAFSAESLATITHAVGSDQLIAASLDELQRFNVNAVNVGRDIVMSECGSALRDTLSRRGYRLHTVDLAPFMLSGGGAFCMTLRLDRHSQSVQMASQLAG